MNQSESIENLIKALIKVQGQLEPARFDADNPLYGSRYATLNAVWDSCRDILNENDIGVIQLPISPELIDLKEQVLPKTIPGQPPEVKIFAVVGLTTRMVHSSGEWIEDDFYIPLEVNGNQRTAQAAGSIITYLRRYALAALLGIVSDEDIDGNDPDQPHGRSKKGRSRKNENAQTVATGQQVRKLCAMGKSVYGDEWKTKQTELVSAVSSDRERGPVNDVTRLYREEIASLISGIKKKKEESP